MGVEGTEKKLRDLHNRLDPGDMLGLVRAMPKHMADAWERGGEFAAGLQRRSFKQIVVCGMGGSAIGGDMVRSYFGDGLPFPLHVNRNYFLPRSLLDDVLFVFSSYSGNTGETLSCYEQARGRGSGAVAITSGGRLEELCRADNIPVCKIPGGLPPRAAIAYSFFPLLRILGAMGASETSDGEFAHGKARVEELCGRYESDGADNTAADLARRIEGKFPLVYSCGGLYDAIAHRWSCQFNENSKSLAHFATFPELNHNEIVGWHALESLRERFIVISLEDSDDHPMARRQAEISLDIVRPLAGEVVVIDQFDGSRLDRVLSALLLGDFTSVYLAYLNGVDPTPVSNIDFLKRKLNT